jgi:Autophagy protein ATG9
MLKYYFAVAAAAVPTACRRMKGSYAHATNYLRAFPAPVWASLMRAVRFVSGAFVAVLLAATMLEDSILLHVKLWDRNLLW